jgi:hypothetical protein
MILGYVSPNSSGPATLFKSFGSHPLVLRANDGYILPLIAVKHNGIEIFFKKSDLRKMCAGDILK